MITNSHLLWPHDIFDDSDLSVLAFLSDGNFGETRFKKLFLTKDFFKKKGTV